MRKIAVTVFVCFCVWGAMSGGQAAGVQTWQKPLANRYFADLRRDIKVDGNLTEWNLRGGSVTIDTATSTMSPPPVKSKADNSAVVKLAWDASHLYLASSIKDQSLQPLEKKEDMPWNCDSLIFVVSTFGATKGSDRYHQIKNVQTSPEPFFGFSYYTPATGARKWTQHSSYVSRKTADGYDIEASVALEDIGFRPATGDRVKMAFILSDHDADGKFSQLIHGFPERIVTSPVNYWLDLRFRDTSACAGEIVPAQTRLLDETAIEFVGDMDVFKEGLRLKSVQMKDAGGKVVASLPAETVLKTGQVTCFSGRFQDVQAPPGKYQLIAAVEEAGKAKDATAPALFEIVSSKETTQGVVGKLPDRYIVPDPYRHAFPSNPWGYRQQTLTKDDYIKMVRKVYDFEYASIYSKGDKADAGIHGFGYCMTPLALYKQSGDIQYLKTALALTRNAYEAMKKSGGTPFWIEQNKIVNLLLNDPNVGEEDRKWLRDFMPATVSKVWETSKPMEWGAFNRALLWGGLLDIASKVLPNHPDVAKWKTYSDLEWNSWWPYRDHDENSSDYNAASFMDYLDWAEFRDPANLKDPAIAKWAERYMYQVTPCGGFPGYGDASPWNASWSAWIPVFERMATITRDGRFKWAAHRLLEYANRQMDDLFSYHMVYDSAAKGCAWGYFYADDTVAEAAPDMKSKMLTRKNVSPVDDVMKKEMFDKYGITGLFYKLSDEMQPDKLLLRAGGDPFAPCGMIELCSTAGHHMSTVPNFNNFMDKRSVLLTDLGYFEKGPEYHNVVYIEDLTGIAPEVPDEVVRVPSLQVGARATYASVTVENYKNWPVTNDRRILFTDSGLVLVKDFVTFVEPFVCRVRQQWQTRNVEPKGGENWVNTCIPHVLMSGLGLGRGVQRWNNPNWDLLIYFTPQPGRDYEVFDRSLENEWQAVPLRVSQRYRGLPEKGKPIHFTTLLYPHKPQLEVDEFVKRITVLKDTPDTTVFKVAFEDKRTIYLGINDTGARVEAGDIATDARVFVFDGDPTAQPMKPTYLLAQDVTDFSVGGKAIHTSGTKANVDRSF